MYRGFLRKAGAFLIASAMVLGTVTPGLTKGAGSDTPTAAEETARTSAKTSSVDAGTSGRKDKDAEAGGSRGGGSSTEGTGEDIDGTGGDGAGGQDADAYIICLPEGDGAAYSYDKTHRSEENSDDAFTILLYGEGEDVRIGVTADRGFALYGADGDLFLEPEGGTFDFAMPDKDLQLVFEEARQEAGNRTEPSATPDGSETDGPEETGAQGGVGTQETSSGQQTAGAGDPTDMPAAGAKGTGAPDSIQAAVQEPVSASAGSGPEGGQPEMEETGTGIINIQKEVYYREYCKNPITTDNPYETYIGPAPVTDEFYVALFTMEDGRLTIVPDTLRTFDFHNQWVSDENITYSDLPCGTYYVLETDYNGHPFGFMGEHDSGTYRSSITKNDYDIEYHEGIDESQSELLPWCSEINITDGDTSHDVTVANIMQEHKSQEIQVNKEWKTGKLGDKFIPRSIGVKLLENGQVRDRQTLSENNLWSYSWFDMPKDASYSIEEDMSSSGVLFDTEISRRYEDDEDGSILFFDIKNTLKTTSLTIKKQVTGEGCDQSKDWRFQFVYPYSLVNVDIPFQKRKQDGSIETGKLHVDSGGTFDVFTLKHNESITFDDFPLLQTSLILEELTDGQSGYTVEFSGENVYPYGDRGSAIDLSTSSNLNVLATNTYDKSKTSSITIKKLVAGEGGDQNKEWRFQFWNEWDITNSDISFEKTKQDGSVVKGTLHIDNDGNSAEFTLKHNESITFKDLQIERDDGTPILYNLKEIDADQEGYTTVFSGDIDVGSFFNTIYLNKSPNANVTVTNTYEKPEASITIKKVVEGEGGDQNKEWRFMFVNNWYFTGDIQYTKTKPDGSTTKGSLHFDTTTTYGNSDEFTLKHNESITFEDVPLESDGHPIYYNLKEIDANQGGYQVEFSGDISSDGYNTVNISKDPHEANVLVTNTYTKPAAYAPQVRKAIEGNPPAESTFEFLLGPKADYGSKVTVVDRYEVPHELSSYTMLTSARGPEEAWFDELAFHEEGTYEFDIREVQNYDFTPSPDYIYDQTHWTLTVEVVEENGKLAVKSASYTADGKDASETEAVFTNTYDPVPFAPKIQKQVLDGSGPVKDYDFSSHTFRFTLSSKEGSPLPDEATAATDGTGLAQWGPVGLERGEEYTYEITEEAGDDTLVDYDTSPHTLTVTVDEEGNITQAFDGKPLEAPDGGEPAPVYQNRLKPPISLPDTGGPGGFALAYSILACLAGAAMALIAKKRYLS